MSTYQFGGMGIRMTGRPTPEPLTAEEEAAREIVAGWLWQFNHFAGDGEATAENRSDASDLLVHLRACGWSVVRTLDAARVPDGLDVRRVAQAITNIAVRNGVVKDPPPQSLFGIFGYSAAPAEMDAKIAREYAALAAQPVPRETVCSCFDDPDDPFRLGVVFDRQVTQAIADKAVEHIAAIEAEAIATERARITAAVGGA